MDTLVVACAQQQMRLFDSAEAFRKELNRFFYMAQAKGAQLIVFPALTGVMAAAPLVEGLGVGLLRSSAAARRAPSAWQRAKGAVAGGTAGLLGANFRRAFVQLLTNDPAAAASAYEAAFADLARAYEMTVVAGSAYLPDADGALRHRSTVFGPDGSVLGQHTALALSAEDEGLATAGETPSVIATPAGRLGILIGEEALYPEIGRILAFEGADLLVTLAATAQDALAAHVRLAVQARAAENQLFALASFLVGKNHLAAGDGSGEFAGRSGIYAPPELTPRGVGVLAEIGSASAEGLLTAELDFGALHRGWDSGAASLRRRMPAGLFAAYLPALYSSHKTLADAWPSDAPVAIATVE